MRVLVFLTVYNEERTIGTLLDRILGVVEDLPDEVDVLVVEDGSEDGTLEEVRQHDVKLVVHPKNLGPGTATRTGYRYAVRNGYDVTVRMDADGQHRPEDIPALLDPIREDEADIVVGSRYKGEADYESTVIRDTGNRFYSWLVSLITGRNITDVTSGYRAVGIGMAREHAEKLPDGIGAIDRGIREGLSDYRIAEIPLEMHQREYGQSFLTLDRLVLYPVYAVYSLLKTLIYKNP